MLFNLRHLQGALEILHCGKLSEAAGRIHLTQSALTQGINKIEKEFGQPLFKRASSGMFATENGSKFLIRVERALAHLQDFATMLFANEKGKKQSFIRSVTSRQLNALITIAELQSYTAAAQRLGLTQPTLHRSIKDLESLTEQTLFQRSPMGVEPTWRARQLRRKASLFFDELAQGIEEFNEASGLIGGSVRIGSLPLSRPEIVPKCVLQLLDQYPLAKVSIVDGPYEEQLQALLHGQLDVIVGALRFPKSHVDIEQHRLFDDPLSIVMKADHPLVKQTHLSNDELQDLKWVVPSKGVPSRLVFDGIFSARGLPSPAHVIECSAMVAIRGLLLNSERASLLPARQVKVEVDNHLLAVSPMPLPETQRIIGLTTRKNWQPTRVQQKLLQIIRQNYT